MAPTSMFGSVVRNAKMSLEVSPSLTFRTDVQLVQMPAKQARGRVSSRANQISPPSALLNSLKELNGTTQRFSTPSHRVQCLLFTLRMLVVPPSGSIRSSCLLPRVWVMAGLTVLLVAALWLTWQFAWRRHANKTDNVLRADLGYWTRMFIAGTFGTVMSDFC